MEHKHVEHTDPRITVIDPVCGMDIQTSDATASHAYDGNIYFFCSAHCLEKFSKDPAEYLIDKTVTDAVVTGSDIQPGASEKIYTCPMHPEVRQENPGSCPKCGMALETIG